MKYVYLILDSKTDKLKYGYAFKSLQTALDTAARCYPLASYRVEAVKFSDQMSEGK